MVKVINLRKHLKWWQIVRAHHEITKAEEQIAENGLVFIKHLQQHIIYNFLHPNPFKTVGIFFMAVANESPLSAAIQWLLTASCHQRFHC